MFTEQKTQQISGRIKKSRLTEIVTKVQLLEDKILKATREKGQMTDKIEMRVDFNSSMEARSK